MSGRKSSNRTSREFAIKIMAASVISLFLIIGLFFATGGKGRSMVTGLASGGDLGEDCRNNAGCLLEALEKCRSVKDGGIITSGSVS